MEDSVIALLIADKINNSLAEKNKGASYTEIVYKLKDTGKGLIAVTSTLDGFPLYHPPFVVSYDGEIQRYLDMKTEAGLLENSPEIYEDEFIKEKRQKL